MTIDLAFTVNCERRYWILNQLLLGRPEKMEKSLEIQKISIYFYGKD